MLALITLLPSVVAGFQPANAARRDDRAVRLAGVQGQCGAAAIDALTFGILMAWQDAFFSQNSVYALFSTRNGPTNQRLRWFFIDDLRVLLLAQEWRPSSGRHHQP
jgi:hypothetical protein